METTTTLFAYQKGPLYSPFAEDRHQSALGPPSIFCFQAFCLYWTGRCPELTYGRYPSNSKRICLFRSYLKKNIVKQINVVVCVNIVVVEWSFLGLNICFDNMQFKYACIFVYNSILFQL